MNKLKRLIVVLISLLFCFLLQTTFLPMIPYLNVVPNLMLIEVMSIGFLFGKSYGLWTGTAAGLLLDIMCSGTPGFYMLLFAWIGYLNGILSEKLESELIYILFILLAANEIVYHAYEFGLSFLIKKQFHFLSYITDIVVPEFLLTMVAFVLVYGVLIFISKRWDLKVNKGEVKVV